MSDDLPPDIGSPIRDPFLISDLTVRMVSAGAGKLKTRTMLTARAKAARNGLNTIISAPTNPLIGEMREFIEEHHPDIQIFEITTDKVRTQYRKSFGIVPKRILKFIEDFTGLGGFLLSRGKGVIVFVTHEGMFRIPALPPQANAFDFYYDEEPETLLTRTPFELRYSYWALTSFLEVNAVPTTLAERLTKIQPPPEFTYHEDESNRYDGDGNILIKARPKSDKSWLDTYALICAPESVSSDQEKQIAAREGQKLLAKRNAWEEWLAAGVNIRLSGEAKSYYLLTPKEDLSQEDPLRWVKLREDGKQYDDVFKILEPLPRWAIQRCPMFVKMADWNATTIKAKPDPNDPDAVPVQNRGRLSIIGFRRPDILKVFRSVTIMSAFFEYTMTYMIWKQLGVKFVRSDEINITDQKTQLGKRKLNIYWLYEDGWSKYIRNNIDGGIEKVLELVKASGVIKPNAKVCVSINKDDAEDTRNVYNVFPNAEIMPHNPRGQNKFRYHHQLIFLPALNPYTSDLEWLSVVLGIDPNQVRICRTGLEAYQVMMRTSLRDKGTHDVDIIVADKDVAEWLMQWFEPSSQVFLHEIDSSGVINRKQKPGPKPKLGRPMTTLERVRKHRADKKRQQKAD